MAGRTFATVVCGMLLGFGAAKGQINFLSDYITIGNAGGTTNHFGQFFLWGSNGASINCGNNGVTVNLNPMMYGISDDCYGGSFYAHRNYPSSRITGVYAYGQGGGTGTGYGFGLEAFCEGNNGTAVYAHGSGGSYAGYFEGVVYMNGQIISSSDRKFKTDISPVSNALDKVMQLRPKTYFYDTVTFREKNFPKNRQFGLIAQDVQTVFPDMVSDQVDLASGDSLYFRDGKPVRVKKAVQEERETFKSVNYMALIPVLIAALQEQQKEIEELKRRLQ